MKLVIYKDDGEVVQIFEGLTDIKTSGFDVEWTAGVLRGIKQNFVILDDTVEVESPIKPEVIALDKKDEYKAIDLAEENKRLRERLVAAENAILSLML